MVHHLCTNSSHLDVLHHRAGRNFAWNPRQGRVAFSPQDPRLPGEGSFSCAKRFPSVVLLTYCIVAFFQLLVFPFFQENHLKLVQQYVYHTSTRHEYVGFICLSPQSRPSWRGTTAVTDVDSIYSGVCISRSNASLVSYSYPVDLYFLPVLEEPRRATQQQAVSYSIGVGSTSSSRALVYHTCCRRTRSSTEAREAVSTALYP